MDCNGEDVTVACSLGPVALSRRAARWRALAARSGPAVATTKRGLRLSFRPGPGVADELTDLVRLERECCAFARWSVRADGSGLVLDITGDSETAVAAVRAMFAGLR